VGMLERVGNHKFPALMVCHQITASILMSDDGEDDDVDGDSDCNIKARSSWNFPVILSRMFFSLVLIGSAWGPCDETIARLGFSLCFDPHQQITEMANLRSLTKNRHFKFGLPFMIAVVGGSFGLQYYSQLRYDIYNERHIITKAKALEKALVDPSKQVTIEQEYEDYKKNVNLDDWQNIRGPRPWENDNEDYKELIERRARESKNQWIFGK
jgi:cytochrome c oxidase assembly protein subunit 16